MMKTIKLSIAGIGNVGSHVIKNLYQKKDYIINKTNINYEIVGISAKNIKKKRIINIHQFKWFENPLDLTV